MKKEEIINILKQVKNGNLREEDALLKFKTMPFDDIGYAKIDNHREIRQGTSEVIFGEGKTPQQISGIVNQMIKTNKKITNILITRMTKEAKEVLEKEVDLFYNEDAKFGIVGKEEPREEKGNILIISAGTSDINICEEAYLTARYLGNNKVKRLYDVGVAGLHRLLSNLDTIMSAKVIIVVAGMEGALASVVGGLVDCPVIAVPTSVGYGANFEGLSALLSMINSCASGVSVVNIDNGFGAGYLANMINQIGEK